MLCLFIPAPPTTTPEFQATTDLSTVSIVLPFPECRIVGIIQYVAYPDRLLSLGNMHLRFLHAYLFLVLNNILLSRWTSLFIHSLTGGHLGCFQVLAIMNKAAINICVQVFV